MLPDENGCFPQTSTITKLIYSNINCFIERETELISSNVSKTDLVIMYRLEYENTWRTIDDISAVVAETFYHGAPLDDRHVFSFKTLPQFLERCTEHDKVEWSSSTIQRTLTLAKK